MSGYESLIAEAMFGTSEDKERSMDRCSLKMAVQQQCVCPCGNVLDQRTSHYFEHEGGSGKCAVVCHTCGTQLSKRLADVAVRPRGIREVTWGKTTVHAATGQEE